VRSCVERLDEKSSSSLKSGELKVEGEIGGCTE
jgi:hypothetical protein